MRSYALTIGLAGLLVGLASCGDKVPTEWDTAQIMPLEVGNRWIYRESFVSIGGLNQTYDTIEIVRKERRTSSSGEEEFTYFDQKGGEYYYVGKELFIEPSPDCDTTFSLMHQCGSIALYPARAGDVYGEASARIRLYIHDSVRDRANPMMANIVLSTDTTISTPAGYFSCYLYTQILTRPVSDSAVVEMPLHYYFRTGVGMVTAAYGGPPIADYGYSKVLVEYTIQ